MKTSETLITLGMVLAVVLALCSPFSVSAQQPESSQQSGKPDVQPSSIAGPEGVAQNLKAPEARTSIFPKPSWLKSYNGWKKHFKDAYGLSLSLIHI